MIKYSRCCKPRLISTLTIDFIKHKEIIHILNYPKRSPNKYSFLKSQNQTALCNNSKQPFVTGIHTSTHTTHTHTPNTHSVRILHQLVWHSITSPLTKESEANLPVSCFYLASCIWGGGMYFKRNAHYKILPIILIFLFYRQTLNFFCCWCLPLWFNNVPSITLVLVLNIFSNFHL